MTVNGSMFSRPPPILKLKRSFVAWRPAEMPLHFPKVWSLLLERETLYFADQKEKASIHMVSVQPAGTYQKLRGMPAGKGERMDADREVSISCRPMRPGSPGTSISPPDKFAKSSKKSKRFQHSLSISPDGRWILYTQAEPDSAEHHAR